MNWSRFFRTFIVIMLWSALLWVLIYLLNVGAIKPIHGTTLLQSGQHCEETTCSHPSALSLPHFSDHFYQIGQIDETFLFAFHFDGSSEGIHAIYLPKVGNDTRILVNGSVVRTAESKGRRWNRPIFTSIPQSALRVGQNEIVLDVVSMAQEGIELQPFYVGPREYLQPHYNVRYFMTVFVAQFCTGLMAILAIVFLIIFVTTRQSNMYFFLFLSCIAAALLSLQFSIDTSWLPYKYWSIVWMYTTPAYILTLAIFIRYGTGLEVRLVERSIAIFTFVAAAIALILPEEYVYRYSVIVNVPSGFAAIMLTTWFWIHQDKFDRSDFRVMFLCMSVAIALGFYVLFMLLWPEPNRNQHLYQFMPFTMVGMSLWLIISRLIRSVDDYQLLTQTQEATIARKTAELETSYKLLAQAEKTQAVEGERQRIMLDLHDGIGGQLTNVLAYMENNAAGDSVLKDALEHALRDLGLMLDSMENDESVATLLGMLRTRLEPLMRQYGLEFDWQIDEDPKLPNAGPSQNLNLLRIVQEAITNAIKYADATTITVRSNATSIAVADDGKGFETDITSENRRGYGLLNMRRRAELLEAKFSISSSDQGTQVRWGHGAANSQFQARQFALNNCGSQCRVDAETQSQCQALATAPGEFWFGDAGSARQAENNALNFCSARSTNCRVEYSYCR